MSPVDDRFYEELGIPRSLWISTPESTWDIWIMDYFNHRKGLQPAERSELHAEIDRFWIMLQEDKYFPPGLFPFDLRGKRAAELTAKHRIESPIGQRADLWLKLAGAYVEGRKRKKKEAARESEASPDIETVIPPGWLNHPGNESSREAYKHWLRTLTEGDNWAKFVRSYKNDTHGVTVRNAPICASLRSFVHQRYLDRYWMGREVKNYGQPLRKPPGQLYWPKLLQVYNTAGGGHYLFQAVENEYLPVSVCQATALGGDLRRDMPPWLTIGYDPLRGPPTRQ